MRREIKLDGGEITLLKALGLSGAPLYGKLLLDRVTEMEQAELLETLDALISRGYVISSKVNITKMEEVERAFFRVNASYARDLRDAIRPGRRRDEERVRRRRRS